MLSIYYVYTQYILSINSVHVLYIIAINMIYMVNTIWYIPRIFLVTVISQTVWSMYGIYMVYTIWYIPVICRCHTYCQYMRSKTFLVLFNTFFYNDIPFIFHEYSFDIQIIYHYKKRYGTNLEMFYHAYTLHMYDIYL
jgi:hypothetical protein